MGIDGKYKPNEADVEAYARAHGNTVEDARRVVNCLWREQRLKQLRVRSSELYTAEAVGSVLSDLLDYMEEDVRNDFR